MLITYSYFMLIFTFGLMIFIKNLQNRFKIIDLSNVSHNLKIEVGVDLNKKITSFL